MSMRTWLVIFIVLTFAMGGLVWHQQSEIRRLQSEAPIVRSSNTSPNRTDSKDKEIEILRARLALAEEEVNAVREGISQTTVQEQKKAKERTHKDSTVVKELAQLVKENPAINEMMAAQQRGTLQYLYKNLIANLDLNPEEESYFLDLLLARQMRQVSYALSAMQGDLSEEERKTLRTELDEVNQAVSDEIWEFLNNEEDFQAFEYYEKTMGTRMEVDAFAKATAAAGEPLEDETYSRIVDMIYNQRQEFPFSTGLDNNDNLDFSSLSQAAIEQHLSELRQFNGFVAEIASHHLSPSQLAAFVKNQEQMATMKASSLRMAAKMFNAPSEEPAASTP